jgi:L-seryl-tRNA(Ser) seleniumtransferase
MDWRKWGNFPFPAAVSPSPGAGEILSQGRAALGGGIIVPVKTASKAELFRQLPSVDELARTPELARLASGEGQAAVAAAVRAVLARLREEISAGRLDAGGLTLALSATAAAVERELRRALQLSLHPVINATGVILHTNLGRAPLAFSTIEHMRETATRYSNLELDNETGQRGQRDVHVDRLFRQLLNDRGGAGSGGGQGTPDASTIVVNNNAAAVLLALNTLADGGEVVVSRGELVEIGGSFRIPDVMSKSNAILREVGTTNRTRIGDYEAAIQERTKLLLRVHRSNFQITGFTEQPALQELVELARKYNLPLLEDLGSGALIDLRPFGISAEPGVLDSLRRGVDVVCYSGDKLLGGPQAGMLSGRSDLIARMRSNSLFRALRVDKLTYAALEATLLAYQKRDYEAIPAVRMMGLSKEEIGRRGEAVAKSVQTEQLQLELLDGESMIGGGSAPSAVLPTRLLAMTSKQLHADRLAAALRASDPPIIARVEGGRVLLDLRTVFPEQDEKLISVLQRLGT